MRLSTIWRIMQVEEENKADNTFRDLHNSSDESEP